MFLGACTPRETLLGCASADTILHKDETPRRPQKPTTSESVVLSGTLMGILKHYTIVLYV